MALYRNHSDPSSVLYIVEDPVSAVVAARHGDGLCIFGVSMSSAAHLAASRYRKIVVFLDDDNPRVQRAATAIQRKLSLSSAVQVHHSGGIDPKEASWPISASS